MPSAAAACDFPDGAVRRDLADRVVLAVRHQHFPVMRKTETRGLIEERVAPAPVLESAPLRAPGDRRDVVLAPCVCLLVEARQPAHAVVLAVGHPNPVAVIKRDA